MRNFKSLKEVIKILREEIIDVSSYIHQDTQITYEEFIKYEGQELNRLFIRNLRKSYYYALDFITDELESLEIRILNIDDFRYDYDLNKNLVIEFREKNSIYSYIYHDSLKAIELIEDGNRIYSRFINV